jgi:hypothetical protein
MKVLSIFSKRLEFIQAVSSNIRKIPRRTTQFGITEGNSTQREVGAEVQRGGSFYLIYMHFPQNFEPWARSVTLAHGQNTL